MGADVASPYAASQYKAFISYSNSDRAWAERLQGALETFHIDKALHGFPTRVGPIPDTLGPIFRDRTHLAAATSLTEQLRGALRSSQFLIVVCSPAAAASEQVNEEIRYFRGLGRNDRILTFIVEGEPSGPAANCFPPALSERLATGSQSDAPHQVPLAADARKVGDDWANARLKLIGGLLGLPLDVIVRRQRDRQAKERYFWGGAVAVFAVMALVAGLSAFQLLRTTERARVLIDGSIESTAKLVQETGRLADGRGVTASAATELLKNIEHLLDNYQDYDANNPRVRLQRATTFLDFAQHYGRLKNTREQERAVKHAIAAIEQLRGSAEFEQKAMALRAEAHWARGNVLFSDGKYKPALEEFERGLGVIAEADAKHFREQTSALGAEQYVPRARLMLSQAKSLSQLSEKMKALEVATRSIRMGRELPLDYRNESDREAAELMVDLRYMAGDLIRQVNDRRLEFDAEAHIDEGLKGALNLHQFDPKRTSFARRVSFLYLSRGDLHRWRGDSTRALEDYKLARTHSEKLSNSDRSDLMMKAGFAFTLIKVGEELNFQRRPLEAVAELEIADKLYGELRQARPNDRIYRQWEWTTVQGLADAYRLGKNEAKALELHHRKLKLANERRQASPEGVSSLLDLAESYQDYGDAHVARGNTQGGLENLVTARKLLEPAVEKPSPDWRFLRLQARILESIARAKLVTKDYAHAREAADNAHVLRERDLARSGKLDPHGQAALAENRRLNASIRMVLGECAQSKHLYEEAVALLDQLVLNYDKPIPAWREQYEGANQALSAINWKDATSGCRDDPVDRRVRDMIAMVTDQLR